MLIIEQLENTEQFTAAERSLAEYILANKDTSLRMTLQRLSEASFVSKPTVIRLYRKLGFEGYTEFQLAFYSELARTSSHFNGQVDPDYPFFKQDDCLSIALKLSELTKRAVDGCRNRMDEEAMMLAARIIGEANRVFIFAIGDSYIQSLAFRNKLVKLDKYVHLVQEIGEDGIHPFNAKQGDCAMFVSFSGNLIKVKLKEINLLKRKNVRMVAVTSSVDDELLAPFNSVLQLEKGENEYLKVGTFQSQIEIAYVLNVLCSCIFGLDFEENIKRNQAYYEHVLELGLL